MAHEEDQDVKMMMGFILEILYDYPTDRTLAIEQGEQDV